MIYSDPYYGEHKLPKFVEKLAGTKLMQRLRWISQANAPRGLFVRDVPTRFEHSMRVCILSLVALRHNREFKDYELFIPMAALLHDAGSAAFSRLGEIFLEQICGKNGEEFLEETIERFGTVKILRSMGLSSKQIVDFVCGRFSPISDIINGSMDLDNIDNVFGFNQEAGIGGAEFNPMLIASSFRFHDGQWAILKRAVSAAKRWQDCRVAVYDGIYSHLFLPITIMLYRAMELAFYAGELTKDFFFLTDAVALVRLYELANPKIKYLVGKLLMRRHYIEVASVEFLEISQKQRAFLNSFEARKLLADAICAELHLPEEHIAVYAGGGRDIRKITLPVLGDSGLEEFPGRQVRQPIYRIKVFAPPEAGISQRAVTEIIRDKLSF